jgi:magnesium-dependent phosphatase 1
MISIENHCKVLIATLLLLVPVASSFVPKSDGLSTTKRKYVPIALYDLPRVIVFDLDATLWTPELYQLRRLQRTNQTPRAGKDVKLFDGARKVLNEIIPSLAKDGQQPPILAIASRTQSVAWAHDLLDQFDLRSSFQCIEIFPAHKTRHFTNIQQKTRVPFDQMMFFDDARDGRYGNCEPIAALGVFCVHCPQGIESPEIFERALTMYRNEWDRSPNAIVEWDGRLTINTPQYQQHQTKQYPVDDTTYNGQIKTSRSEKQYGFIRYRKGNARENARDIFFHFNNLGDGISTDDIREGDDVTFQIQRDPKTSKDMAVNVTVEYAHDKATVQFRCFSMNQPFAALLANGYKTLETRNGTMFAKYAEGTVMLLHVGRRTYPDQGKHYDIMKNGSGLSDEEIEKLKSLPPGFSRGSIVAIVELGRQYETTIDERGDPEFEQKVAARGEDSGRFVTEIKRVEYLKRPVKKRGEGGIFKTRIDPTVIPDGWDVPSLDDDVGSALEVVYPITG